MTDDEAIERIKYRIHTVEQIVGRSGMEDLEMAIKALEEVQQYRAIGTIEEYQKAVRKIKSDKVLKKHKTEAQKDITEKKEFSMKIELEIPKEFEKDYKWLALVSPSQNILIYEDQYLEIAEFIRDMLNVHPKTEKAKGKTTKHWMLQEDRMKAEQNQNEENKSTLLPLVSACVNHPGFKYKLEELKQVNICQFMDSVQRIQKYEQGVAAMHGIYGGFVNAKDIPQDLINFMSDL